MFRPFIPRPIYNLLTYSRIKSENDNRFKTNTSADGYKHFKRTGRDSPNLDIWHNFYEELFLDPAKYVKLHI